LPLLLSGFLYQFHGMAIWPPWIGEAFLMTHILRVVRGII
jgi:ABC-2 type transport system permease protein